MKIILNPVAGKKLVEVIKKITFNLDPGDITILSFIISCNLIQISMYI